MTGEKIQTLLTHAPGNGTPIGGIKVIAESGWFAARPSGTESIYKDLCRELQRRESSSPHPGGSAGHR
jgi:phosphoglucomutase